MKRLSALRKGFVGEVRFGELLRAHLGADCIVLYDLLLKENDSVFQLDCVIILQRKVLHVEVKNFEGDFLYKDGQFFDVSSGKEVKNPLVQLERGQFLLKQALGRLGYDFPVESKVMFAHPEFALYENPRRAPIVLPSQIKRFIRSLNNTPSRMTGLHRKLADDLFDGQILEGDSDRLPDYDFSVLQKGIRCLRCEGFLVFGGRKLLVCEGCGYKELASSAILRNVIEFRLLFPDEKVTTRKIWNWCDVFKSDYAIRRTLTQFMERVGAKRHTHFVFPKG